MEKLEFEPNAVRFLKIVQNTNTSVLLTWKAWAWKSTLLNFFKSKTKKKYVLLWTTWVSAEMIWWQTIHRFFWIRNWRFYLDQTAKDIIRNIDLFIIDEWGMTRADLFDLMNSAMQYAMNNDKFLWWKQFIFVWDLYQLPPVPEREFLDKDKTKPNPKYQEYQEKYNWLFFFNAKSYDPEQVERIQLNRVFRQKDEQLVSMLNRVRIWDNRSDVINYFNQRYIDKKDIHPKSILIWSINSIVDRYNNEKTNQNPNPINKSKAFIQWEFPEDIYPTKEWIIFKEKDRVMFTVNDKDGKYMNWTLWTIQKVIWNKVFIERDDWIEIEVDKNNWFNIDWEDEFWEPIIIWTFTQYPFVLAYAITIHKSQWKTFDNIVIDLWWWAFAPWQVYVAVSRAKTFEWIQFLTKLKRTDIFADNEVTEYLNSIDENKKKIKRK